MTTPREVRLDKWLWSVRLFKTRTLAARACLSGKVYVNTQRAKPARCVRVGEIITAATGDVTRTVKVTALLDRRVGAKLVSQFCEDLTPASEYEKPREKFSAVPGFRSKGLGRPTKKARRSIEEFLD